MKFRLYWWLFFCMVFLFNGHELSARNTVIKMATLAPEGTEWHGLLVEMGQRWKAKTGGDVILRLYPGGVVGDERDMIRKMRIGQIHAAAISMEGLQELNPDVYAFILPMIFDDYDDVDWFRERISDDLARGIAENGFKVLTWADVGWAYWYTREPIRVPEDLKDQRIFTTAGDYRSAELWKTAGFNAVPLATTDVLSGLQTGLVDAASTAPMFALSSQWFGVANHMLDMKWGLVTAAVVIDMRVWNRIAPEHQIVLEEIARDIGRQHQETNRYDEQKAIDAMRKYGLKVHHLTEEEHDQWKDYVDDWYPQLRDVYLPAPMYDKMLELKAEKDSLDHQEFWITPDE